MSATCKKVGESCTFSNDCCDNLYCIGGSTGNRWCKKVGDPGIASMSIPHGKNAFVGDPDKLSCCYGACNCKQAKNCCSDVKCDEKSGDCR